MADLTPGAQQAERRGSDHHLTAMSATPDRRLPAPRVDALAELFALEGPAVIEPVARGAMGRVWRLRAGNVSWAVKDFFWEMGESTIADEIALQDAAAGAGVRLARSVPSTRGAFLERVARDDGTQATVRLYEWLEVAPLPAAPLDRTVLEQAGEILAVLHRVAPPTAREAHPWYVETLAGEAWRALAETARDVSPELCAEIAGRVSGLAALADLVEQASAEPMRICHLDFAPSNVFVARDGALAVLDWDDAGPAAVGRELASALVAWTGVRSASVDDGAVRAFAGAYRRAGGTGALDDMSAFASMAAARLNYIDAQVRLAADAGTASSERTRAVAEAGRVLRALPRMEDLQRVLASAS